MTDMKRLLAEATPLPWRFITDKSEPEGSFPVGIDASTGYPGERGWIVRFDDDYGTNSWRNGELIVAAVNAVPDYEAAVELAEKYHSGHSVVGKACDCDLCRELAEIRRRLRGAS